MAKYELYHHGIKGMKWGVRRYQNKDGSLTALGQKRQRQRITEDVRGIVRNTYKPYGDPNYVGTFETKALVKSISEVTALTESTKLKSIKAEKDELEKPLRKIVSDFHSDKRLVQKYLNKQKKIDPSTHGSEYLHLYLKDVGFDYDGYSKKHHQLFNKYIDTCKELTSDLLQEYGDKPVLSMREKRTLGRGASYEKRQVKTFVESALLDGWFNEDDVHWFY